VLTSFVIDEQLLISILDFWSSRFQAMVTTDDCECVSRLLRNTISMLCENSLKYGKGLKIEGILAITVDLETIFIVHVNETLERGDENVAVVGKDRSPVRSADSHIYRPPAAKKLALMPPPSKRSIELAVPEVSSHSVLAWPLKSSVIADCNTLTFPAAQKPTHTVQRQIVFRGRRVPLVARGSRVPGPRFPISRPRLIVPDSHRIQRMPRMSHGAKTTARVLFNPCPVSCLPVAPGLTGVLQKLPVQSARNLSLSNSSQKSKVIAGATISAQENCKLVASHQTAASSNVMCTDRVTMKQRLAVLLQAKEQKSSDNTKCERSPTHCRSGMQVLAVEPRPRFQQPADHPHNQMVLIQQSAGKQQPSDCTVPQMLAEQRLGSLGQLCSAAGQVMTAEQGLRGQQPLAQCASELLQIQLCSREQQPINPAADQLAARPLQTGQPVMCTTFCTRASRPSAVIAGHTPAVQLSPRQQQPRNQKVQDMTAVSLTSGSQQPVNKQLVRTPSVEKSTSEQRLMKEVASEKPDYKQLHSQQVVIKKCVRQVSNAELIVGKQVPAGVCTTQTAVVMQSSHDTIDQPYGRKVTTLQSVNQSTEVQPTASINEPQSGQPMMVVMTRAPGQPRSVNVASLKTAAKSLPQIDNQSPHVAMRLPLGSVKHMASQQQGIYKQIPLDIPSLDNPLSPSFIRPQKTPPMRSAEFSPSSLHCPVGLRPAAPVMSVHCGQRSAGSVQQTSSVAHACMPVQLPHVSVFSRPANASYETFLPSLLHEQHISSDSHTGIGQSSCVSACNPCQFTQGISQPAGFTPSHSMFSGQLKGPYQLSQSSSLPNTSVSMSPHSSVTPAVACSSVSVKSAGSVAAPSCQQFKSRVAFSGNQNQNLTGQPRHLSKVSESQQKLMMKTMKQIISKPQDRSRQVLELQAPRQQVQQEQVPMQNLLCAAQLPLQQIDMKSRPIQQQHPQQWELGRGQSQIHAKILPLQVGKSGSSAHQPPLAVEQQSPRSTAYLSKMTDILPQQCLLQATELPRTDLISDKLTGSEDQYNEWCQQFVNKQVQKVRESQVVGQEHNKTRQTERNHVIMTKLNKQRLLHDKHNAFHSSVVSHHQEAVSSISQMSTLSGNTCSTTVSASTRDCTFSICDTGALPRVNPERLNCVLSYPSPSPHERDALVNPSAKETGTEARSTSSSDKTGDVHVYRPYSRVTEPSKPAAETRPHVRESLNVLTEEPQNLLTCLQDKDSSVTADATPVSPFTAGGSQLPDNLPGVENNRRPALPQLTDGQPFVLPEELQQLEQQPLNDLGKRTVESHTDEVCHQQTVDQVQQLLSSEFHGDEFDDLNLSCSANVDDECRSSDSEATILSTWCTDGEPLISWPCPSVN
jgi:hypothetical protein